jgi:hypothetical protein
VPPPVGRIRGPCGLGPNNVKMRSLMLTASAAVTTPSMRKRYQKFIWRIQDLALPIGPPVFLTFVILLLLIVNGAIVWTRS